MTESNSGAERSEAEPFAAHEPSDVRPDAGSNHGASSDEKPSGLRNPTAAVRGVGAGALIVEALVLLLAIQPMRVLGVRLTGAAIGSIIALAVICVLLAGMLRRDWAWYAGFVVQGALIACGFFHVSLAILGVLFLLVWVYVISVRRTVLGRS